MCFDVTMQHSKVVAKLGANGYDLLILINRLVKHTFHEARKRDKYHCPKENQKTALRVRNICHDFETVAA